VHSLSLGASALVIPFAPRSAHGAVLRDATQTLWVEASDTDGHCGYGEACARVHLTGETLDDAIAFVREHGDYWCDAIDDVASLRAWVDTHAEDIDAHPATWCAVELALLDLFGRRRGLTLETLLKLPAPAGRCRYTAVLGETQDAIRVQQLKAYAAEGFDFFKVRLSGVLERDRALVRTLQAAAISPRRVRASARQLWHSAREAVFYLRQLAYPFAALEEPASIGAVHEMAEIGRALGCTIVVDESLTRLEHLHALPGGTRFIANLRVSKMGGLLRALAIARAAAARRLPIIVGADVGETRALAHVASVLTQACHDQVIAQECAFRPHLRANEILVQHREVSTIRTPENTAGGGVGVT